MMIRSVSALHIFAIVLTITSVSSRADQRSQCEPLSFVDTTTTKFNYSDKLAYLNEVNSANWGETSKKISAGVTLPIEVPIQAQGSYQAFSDWWNSYKQTIKYNRETTEDLSIVTSKVTGEELAKYRLCLSGVQGLSAFGSLEGNVATVEVAWHPAPPVPGETLPNNVPISIDAHTKNGSVPTDALDLVINGNGNRTFQLEPGVPLTVTASIAGSQAVTMNFSIPRIYSCTLTTKPKSETRDQAYSGDNNQDPAGLPRLQGYPKVWKAELESKGHINVSVQMLRQWEENHKHRGGGGYYKYLGTFQAEYDGESHYGPDPRCVADEPPPGHSTTNY